MAAVADQAPMAGGGIRYASAKGRWIIAAMVAGSGISFLDSTVVNVALPAIGRDLHAGIAGLQWTVDAYLVTLGGLLLLGGSLGDIYGRRRVFVIGLVIFTIASVACGLAPSIPLLVAGRAVQGVGGALLVPGSLAIISASFEPADRAPAIGAWSGLSGVTTVLGPFLGGYFVDSLTWRLVFFINVPLALMTAWITLRHVPESRDVTAGQPDPIGAALAALSFSAMVFGLIEASARGISDPMVVTSLVVGGALFVTFLVFESRHESPMLPLELFRSRLFDVANAATLAVYFGLGGAMFFLMIELQHVLGYSALSAGMSLIPITILMLLFSARAGKLSERIGPRVPMTIGPLVMGGGLLLLSQVGPGTSYVSGVLPGVVAFAAGLTLTVAPLTATVLGSVETTHAGVGSGVNNAVARLAGLFAVALVPLVARVDGLTPRAFDAGYGRAMLVCAFFCAAGGVVSAAGITTPKRRVRRHYTAPTLVHTCVEPSEKSAA